MEWQRVAVTASQSVFKSGVDRVGMTKAECREEVERNEEEDVAWEVFCPGCVAATDAEAWSVKVDRQFEAQRGQCRFVYCLRCGSETIIV